MRATVPSRRSGVLAGAFLALLASACSKPEPQVSPPENEERAADHASWVKIYRPRESFDGYTLTLHRARVPVLLDMNGRRVHSWPGARVKSRVRLLPEGSILALALNRSVVEYDWTGRETWRYNTSPDLPHHDVIRLDNGNTMFPVLPADGDADEILEVNRAGDVVWRWRAREHLASFISAELLKKGGDLTHINSVRELPGNRWHRDGDDRFRPGNLLISARNLNRIFIIDRSSGAVTWSYGDELDLQHEAIMIPSGSPGAGNILLFDNGYRQTHRYRKSRIIEINPVTNSVVWEYSSENFYSPTSGVQQPLPNGNILIGSSRGGRIFEIDRQGRTVWEWTPPFHPVRPLRYPRDHCPQLAAMGSPESIAVEPQPGYRYVDRPVYRFAHRGMRREKLEQRIQKVLAKNNMCSLLLLPGQPRVWASYGVSKRRVRASGKTGYVAEFSLRYRQQDSQQWTELIDDTVSLEGKHWFARSFNLDKAQYQWIEMCVSTREAGAKAGEPTEAFAFWNGPKITSRSAELQPTSEEPPDDLTGDELDVRERHLEALGYVN